MDHVNETVSQFMEAQSVLRTQSAKQADDLRTEIVGKLNAHMKNVQDSAVAQNEALKTKALHMEKVPNDQLTELFLELYCEIHSLFEMFIVVCI